MRAPPPLVVILVVGLTRRLLAQMPRLRALADAGALVTLEPPLPAVTCTSQATMLTGALPRDHGIVGNGWYERDLAEVLFWRQSNRLVGGDRLWRRARAARPGLRTAQLFWWFNMYADVELAATPRPHYAADGRKVPGIYTEPPALERELEGALGPFPLFQFWGPAAGIASSRWIAGAARLTLERHRPELTLVYLPHLDYELQRSGPAGPAAAGEALAIDAVAGDLADAARAAGARVALCSEYGLAAVDRPVYPNRALREAGLLRVRESPVTGALLDAGASRAFAVADHQVAHIYVRDPADRARAREVLERLDGVERVLEGEDLAAAGLDHPRSGDLVLLAAEGAWCAYPYWLDDRDAPDFARTVDIHRKPGYDPVELFLAPGAGTRLRLALRLAQKRLGFRALLDVIPLDASLVRGSHGRPPASRDDAPILVVPDADALVEPGAPGGGAGAGGAFPEHLPMTAVQAILLRLLALR